MIFLFPILIIIGLLFVKIESNNVYEKLIQDDSFIEYLQFIAYGGASILAIFGGLGCLNKGCFMNGFILLVFAAHLMFVSLEEISWGQRLFSISSPEWFLKYNVQREINIHNLNPVQHVLPLLYVSVGTLFSLGWMPAKYISSCRRLRIGVKTTIRLFSPRWYLVLFFVPTTIINVYFLLATRTGQKMLISLGWKAVQVGHFVIWRDQEPTELLLSFGLLLYVAIVIIGLKDYR